MKIISNPSADEARALWHECFPSDPDVFLDLYFNEVYRPENTLLLRDETTGLNVAHIQCLPYKIYWHGMELSAGYISGACTLPEYRGRGLMRDLMNKAFDLMRSRGDVLSFLIPAEPWLYDFYRRKAGYETTFFHRTVTSLSAQPAIPPHADAWEFIAAAERMNEGVLHTPTQWNTVRHDLELAGGGYAEQRDNEERVEAVCWYLPQEETLRVPCIYGNQNATERLINRLMIETHCSKIEISESCLPSEGTPKGMLRILNTEAMLKVLPPEYVVNLPKFLADAGLRMNMMLE